MYAPKTYIKARLMLEMEKLLLKKISWGIEEMDRLENNIKEALYLFSLIKFYDFLEG